MSKLWLQIATIVDEDERRQRNERDGQLIAERQRAQQQRYEAYMRQHMPPTHEPIVGNEFEMWG